MTKSELLRLLRLLSGLESLLIYNGRLDPNQGVHIPDYLLEELTAMSEVLEREILQ